MLRRWRSYRVWWGTFLRSYWFAQPNRYIPASILILVVSRCFDAFLSLFSLRTCLCHTLCLIQLSLYSRCNVQRTEYKKYDFLRFRVPKLNLKNILDRKHTWEGTRILTKTIQATTERVRVMNRMSTQRCMIFKLENWWCLAVTSSLVLAGNTPRSSPSLDFVGFSVYQRSNGSATPWKRRTGNEIEPIESRKHTNESICIKSSQILQGG